LVSRVRTFALDGLGSFAWVAHDRLERASCAVAVDGGCVVIDPVDAHGVDAALLRLGPVVAVATLLDRHRRDSAAVAARHGAPLHIPLALGGAGIGLPGIEERTVIARRGWRETLLWLPERRLLVCPETIGTARYYLARADDPLGVHPFRRLSFPERPFEGLDPEAIAVGHGPPVTEHGASALGYLLARARSDALRAWVRAGRVFFSGA
jgi:hypothetical protein